MTKGADADILLLDKSLGLCDLYSRGKLMVKDGKPIVLGMFERCQKP
ncbi:MAG: hypothetical protein FWE91_02630 [Defluviitaleaceae bacterium]|nr:hypothetical protein [Defluviitaleaceae bacterium]MCL2835574.1 hypothetical protein [Defluviitaleaceae bacterium]